MILDRRIKPTLTPFELDLGDSLRLTLDDGRAWEMTLDHTSASVLERGQPAYSDLNHYQSDIKVYGCEAQVRINGQPHVFQRKIGSQESFYEPWVIDNVRVWFDAAACAFSHPPRPGGIIHEKDWAHRQICSPSRAGRFVVQQANRPIAPEPIGVWFDSQKPVPDIRECYMGEDCWMGPYNGGAAHCGLDINMPPGTILKAPIALDDQYIFNGQAAGIGCERWRGVRRWPDGSDWIIQSHHLMGLLVEQRIPLARGTPYATAAGTYVGHAPHTHFMFRVIEQGGDYLLDPWLLFWARKESPDLA